MTVPEAIARSMKTALAAAVLLIASPAPAAAQHTEPCAPLDVYGTLSLSCADLRPRLDSAATVLLRRVLLRTGGTWAGFEGEFAIAFTVDTTGRVIPPTLRVVDLDSSRFAQRLPGLIFRALRYRPAVRAGAPVPVAYEQRFAYRHPGDRDGELSVAPLLLHVDESADARGGTVRLEWVPVAPAPLPELDAGRSRERQVDAIAAVLADSSFRAEAVACVALREGDKAVRATPDEIERLRSVHQPVASPGECPETYNTGWAAFNRDGTPRTQPPGASPDPYVFAVTQVIPWTDDWVVVGSRCAIRVPRPPSAACSIAPKPARGPRAAKRPAPGSSDRPAPSPETNEPQPGASTAGRVRSRRPPPIQRESSVLRGYRRSTTGRAATSAGYPAAS